jgi:hypothetical protein
MLQKVHGVGKISKAQDFVKLSDLKTDGTEDERSFHPTT